MPSTQETPALARSLPEKFGVNLRVFREAEGLSIDEFGTLLSLDPKTIEAIEQGQQPDLTLHAAEVIAATLGIEPLLLLE